MSVRYRYVRDSRMYRLVPRLVEGGWFYESNERGREIDDPFFFRDTGSFPIACTVNDHFAPSFRVIQRGVEIVERPSFLPSLPPLPLDWVGYLFIATIDPLFFPPSFSSFSKCNGFLDRVGILFLSTILILDVRLSKFIRIEKYTFFFEFVYRHIDRDETVRIE